MDLTNLINTTVPYVVGSKTASSGLPVNVKVSIDPDLKKSLFKIAAMFTVGVGIGVAVGVACSKPKTK